MIVSFKVEAIEDLELLLSLTKRLGIEKVDNEKVINVVAEGVISVSDVKKNDFEEVNDEIDAIFGLDNSNISF